MKRVLSTCTLHIVLYHVYISASGEKTRFLYKQQDSLTHCKGTNPLSIRPHRPDSRPHKCPLPLTD